MCVLKVANARKSEQRLRVEGVRDDEMDGGAASGVMFPGHNREREMSAMVTALTNVVAGHVSDDLVNQTGSDPCCLLGSCSWGAGHKRGRDDQGHVSESVSTISRAFGDLSHGGSSSFRGVSLSLSLPPSLHTLFQIIFLQPWRGIIKWRKTNDKSNKECEAQSLQTFLHVVNTHDISIYS